MKIIRVTCKDEESYNSLVGFANKIKKKADDVEKLVKEFDKLFKEVLQDPEAIKELKIKKLKEDIYDTYTRMDHVDFE